VNRLATATVDPIRRSTGAAADAGNGRETANGGEKRPDVKGYTVPSEVLQLQVKVTDENDQGEEKTVPPGGFEPPTTRLGNGWPPDEIACDSREIAIADPTPSSNASSSPANPVAFTPKADLARIVELWPVLPPAIRAAVLVLVNTSAPSSTTTRVNSDADDRDRLPPGYERGEKTR
jgi:hypothetical protein